jgi:hypothetical protein
VRFDERMVSVGMTPSSAGSLTVSFEWDVRAAALVEAAGGRALFRWQDFEYSVQVNGVARRTPSGWSVESAPGFCIEMRMAQAK